MRSHGVSSSGASHGHVVPAYCRDKPFGFWRLCRFCWADSGRASRRNSARTPAPENAILVIGSSREGGSPMSDLHCIHLTSVEELRASASAWDDLWWRSEVALPTVRAELLAQWVEQFKPRAQFHALVVADQERWVAALPLVPRRVDGCFRPADCPPIPGCLAANCCWIRGRCRTTPLDRLLAAAAELPWPIAVAQRGRARGAALAGIAPGVRSGRSGRLLPPAVSRRPRRDRSELGHLSKTFAQEPSSGDESGLAAAGL